MTNPECLKKKSWDDHLYTKDEMDKLYKITHGFTDDDLPKDIPIRPKDETFEEFMEKGAKELVEKFPDIVKQLL